MTKRMVMKKEESDQEDDSDEEKDSDEEVVNNRTAGVDMFIEFRDFHTFCLIPKIPSQKSNPVAKNQILHLQPVWWKNSDPQPKESVIKDSQ